MDEKQQFVKVVETSDVTAESLEEIINDMMRQNWLLDTIHFAMREGSRRPSMAFLIFYNADGAKNAGFTVRESSVAK